MLFNPWPKLLRQARNERGLTQDNAADRAGVTEVTWNRWENGKVHPGHKAFPKLALGVDLSEDELGYRYAQALARHYEERLTAAPEPGGPPADAPRAGDRWPPFPEDNRQPSRPAQIRGFSSDSGAIWIDVNQIFEALAAHQAIGSAVPRPDERRPRIRRDESRSEG